MSVQRTQLQNVVAMIIAHLHWVQEHSASRDPRHAQETPYTAHLVMNERQQERIAHRTLVLRPNQGAALTRVTQSTGYTAVRPPSVSLRFLAIFFTRFASFAGKSVVLTWSGAAAGSNRSGVIVRNTGELKK